MRRAALGLAFALAAPWLAACETFVEASDCDTSPASNPLIAYDGGATMSCSYTTLSAPGGELLLFNGGMRYALDHHLGCAPSSVQVFLSFDENGLGVDGGQLGPAAGNQAVIEGWDATSIKVANDSCSDYWLLVTAEVADPSSCSCQ